MTRPEMPCDRRALFVTTQWLCSPLRSGRDLSPATRTLACNFNNLAYNVYYCRNSARLTIIPCASVQRRQRNPHLHVKRSAGHYWDPGRGWRYTVIDRNDDRPEFCLKWLTRKPRTYTKSGRAFFSAGEPADDCFHFKWSIRLYKLASDKSRPRCDIPRLILDYATRYARWPWYIIYTQLSLLESAETSPFVGNGLLSGIPGTWQTQK